MSRTGGRYWVTGLVIAAAACGGSGASSPTSTSADTSGFPQGTHSLTHAVVDPAMVRWITPLGNLNPPGHTLPTDHIYLYIANPDAGESPVARRTTVYAPGSGTVYFVIGGGAGQESKLMIRQTTSMSYYVDHVILTAPITTGTVITAGQVLGTSGSAYAVDLGVVNNNITVGFINPSRYLNKGDALHADGPLKYYADPLRSQLYAMVQRLGPDLDGQTNYDKAGTLAGNWFTPDGNFSISFAFDTYDPSRPLISAGVGAIQGVFGLAPGDPLPGSVTVGTGRVLYTLHRTYPGPGRILGPNSATVWMLVQLLDDSRMRVETSPTSITDFSDRALSLFR